MAERRAVAPSHLTDEDLYQLRAQADSANQQRRQELAKNNDYLMNQVGDKVNKAQTERNRQIEAERANHQRLQQ